MSEYYKPYTSRDVCFDIFPREGSDAVDTLIDALVDHYWERSPLRWFVTPGIGACGREVHVGSLPRWMPKWWALRTVANIALRAEVGGCARFITRRNVLSRV